MNLYKLGIRIGKLEEKLKASEDQESLADLVRVARTLEDLNSDTPESVLKYFVEDIDNIERKVIGEDRSGNVKDISGTPPCSEIECDKSINSDIYESYRESSPIRDFESPCLEGIGALDATDYNKSRDVDLSWVRCEDYKNVLKGKKSYKDFLKDNPEILARQRREMFINACCDMRNPMDIVALTEAWNGKIEFNKMLERVYKQECSNDNEQRISRLVSKYNKEYLETAKDMAIELGVRSENETCYRMNYMSQVLEWMGEIQQIRANRKFKGYDGDLTYMSKKLLLMYIKTKTWRASSDTSLSDIGVSIELIGDFITGMFVDMKGNEKSVLWDCLDEIEKFLQNENVCLGHIYIGYKNYEEWILRKKMVRLVRLTKRCCVAKGLTNENLDSMQLLNELHYLSLADSLNRAKELITNIKGVCNDFEIHDLAMGYNDLECRYKNLNSKKIK